MLDVAEEEEVLRLRLERSVGNRRLVVADVPCIRFFLASEVEKFSPPVDRAVVASDVEAGLYLEVGSALLIDPPAAIAPLERPDPLRLKAFLLLSLPLRDVATPAVGVNWFRACSKFDRRSDAFRNKYCSTF